MRLVLHRESEYIEKGKWNSVKRTKSVTFGGFSFFCVVRVTLRLKRKEERGESIFHSFFIFL